MGGRVLIRNQPEVLVDLATPSASGSRTRVVGIGRTWVVVVRASRALLVALFDDEATYRANASSPEQGERFQRLRELLEDDPDWMDGTFTGA